jgi:uncharacterized protein YgiM (DUF1202 family)
MRRRALIFTVASAVLVSACGRPSGVVTDPPVSGGASTTGASSSTGGAQTSGTRTVLAQLGLNLHDQPAVTARVVGTAARGVELTVVAFRPDNGGWYQVKGQTTTGWITADPALSASGSFLNFSSDDKQFSVLYPQSWTYADSTVETVFMPQSGDASMAVRPASSRDNAGLPGYQQASDTQVVACGYTGDLITYNGGPASPQATSDAGGGKVRRLAHFAQLWLKFDATHFLDLEANYSADADLQTFTDLANSIVFPHQQCEQVATPAATPTPA